MNNKEKYKRLGDYIREVNSRNKNLAVTNLRGINIDKYFMPSVANVIGTDLSNYKIVEKNQFACNFMHVGRDEKLPVAIQKDDTCIIVSPAYFVFEVIDDSFLLPDYLMLWFSRKEFDRNIWFHTDADVRGGMNKVDFCDIELLLPSIEEQRKIVSEYQTLTKRIEVNNQLIAKLEDTIQTLYRKMFVDGIDKENLPEGWRMGTIGEFCTDIKSGGTPSRTNIDYWNKHEYPWLKTGEIHNNIVFDSEEYISEEGLKNSSAKLIPKGSVIMAMYGATAGQIAYLDFESTTNQACCNMICNNTLESAYLFFHLLYYQQDIKRLAIGGAQENLSQDVIASQLIIIPKYTDIFKPFFNILQHIKFLSKENIILQELQSLILSKMGQ